MQILTVAGRRPPRRYPEVVTQNPCRSCLARVVVFVLLLTSPAAAQDMFGTLSNVGGVTNTGAIGIVNQTDASFALLGDPTPDEDERLPGISFDASGRLFGSVVIRASSRSILILINPDVGTRDSTIGDIKDAGANDIRIIDLATHPSTDVLYGVDSDARLYTIDKATAVATLVGDIDIDGGSDADKGGIAFTPNGNLYIGTKGQKFARIDPANGSIIGAVADLENCVDGLGARPDGVLFATGCDDSPLFRIDDPGNPSLTLVGDPDPEYFADLAFRLAPTSIFGAPVMGPVGLAALAILLVVFSRQPKSHRSRDGAAAPD